MGTGSTDFVYGKARKAFYTAGINWATESICAMLVSAVYSPNPNTDQFVSDVPSGAIIVRDRALVSLGVSAGGVCFGTVPAFNSLIAAPLITAMILYSLRGTDGTSPLIYYTSSGSGFPFFAQGFNYVVGFDQSNGGYF